ncbi:MAG: 23S rRNA (uracil1939-C5)-methyltransferase [Candidatus Endobugula sp.]
MSSSRYKSPASRKQSKSSAASHKSRRKPGVAATTGFIGHDKEVVVERLADDGRGIATVNGQTLFIDGALVDETVTVTVTHSSSRYIESRVRQLIVASSQRREPLCPVFSRCGGCSVQYMPIQDQLAFKQRTVLSQLSRWSSVVPDNLLPPISDQEYRYRQRVRLAVDYTKTGEVMLGFREADSHAIVNTDRCEVLSSSLESMLPLLREWLSRIPANVVSHIELVNTATAIGVVIRHIRSLSNVDKQALLLLLDSLSVVANIWFQPQKGSGLYDAEGQLADPRLSYEINADKRLKLQFHPQDFIQSNHHVNQQMILQAIELLAPQSNEVILDLFCGIGNFSLPLALRAKHVIGIEGINPMVARATANAKLNQIDNASFMAKDLSAVDSWTALLRSGVGSDPRSDLSSTNTHSASSTFTVTPLTIDALLLDPPRAGAKAVCEKINELSPQRIVYVSCDSSTFSRDAGILVNSGYRLAQLGVMDMFPQTSHVEIMALFTIDPSFKKGKISRNTHQKSTRSVSSVKTSSTKIKRTLKSG